MHITKKTILSVKPIDISGLLTQAKSAVTAVHKCDESPAILVNITMHGKTCASKDVCYEADK